MLHRLTAMVTETDQSSHFIGAYDWQQNGYGFIEIALAFGFFFHRVGLQIFQRDEFEGGNMRAA